MDEPRSKVRLRGEAANRDRLRAGALPRDRIIEDEPGPSLAPTHQAGKVGGDSGLHGVVVFMILYYACPAWSRTRASPNVVPSWTLVGLRGHAHPGIAGRFYHRQAVDANVRCSSEYAKSWKLADRPCCY